MTSPRITLAMLRGACKGQRDIFKAEWPNGVDVTLENVQRAQELGLDLYWGAKWFTPEARAEYKRQRAPLWEEYQRQITPLRAEYDRQVAPIRGEYARQRAPLWAEYQRQAFPEAFDMEHEGQVAAVLGIIASATGFKRDAMPEDARILYDFATEKLEKRSWVETSTARELAPERRTSQEETE